MKKKLVAMVLLLCVASTGCTVTKQASVGGKEVFNETTVISGNKKTEIPEKVASEVEEQNVSLVEELPTDVVDTAGAGSTLDIEVNDPAEDAYVIASDVTSWYAYDAVNNYTFTLEGDTYTLPCKLSEFTDNGWVVDSAYSFETLEQGSTQYFDMTKGDKTINIGMRNHNKAAAMSDETEVFQIRVTHYSGDESPIDMICPNGIMMGMEMEINEETVPWSGERVPSDYNDNETVFWQFWEPAPDTVGIDVGGVSYETTDGKLSQCMVQCDAMGSDFTGE